jgi:hypothetical protein
MVINNNINKIFNENLWSIFIDLNDKTKISISRHGFSFANLIKERKKKGLIGKIEQKMEKDAKLSLYGILTALLHGNDLVEKEKKYGMEEPPRSICVSVLIRTWMTAICLYLPHCIDNNFNLIVSPFIKETGFGLDNEPESFDKQISTIKDFLNYLIKISDVKFSRTRINDNLLKIKNFFKNGYELNIVTTYKSLLQGQHNKTVHFYYTDNEIQYDITTPKKSFFNKVCTDKINFEIENVEIFHGEYKPLKQNIKTKFTRWCEPFSTKNSFTNIKSLCKSRLSKNIKNSLNNIVFNNNEINLKPREALYERPNNNLNFSNINNILQKQYPKKVLNSTPVNSTSVKSTSVNSTPVNSTSVNNTPVNSTSVNNTPVKSTLVKSTPVKSTSVNNTSVNNTSVNSRSVNSTFVNSTSVNNKFLNSTSVNNKSVNSNNEF